MRALAFHAPFSLRCESVPEPRLEAPTDVLLRVDLAAICGSDLHVYRGVEAGLDAGTVMGHEFLGTVIEAGAEVRRWKPGARVVSPFSTSCGACFFCRRALPSRCEMGQLFGWVEHGRGLHGGQAEYVRVPLADATLVELPAGVPEEQALLAGDVLSTGLFAAENGGVQRDDLVCVLGCGPVGLAAVIGALSLGARSVIAVDSVPERRALAERFGAQAVDLGSAEARVRAASEQRGADVVLEVVGSPQASALAYQLVRIGGTISAPGVHNEPTFAFSPGKVYDKNLTYRAGRAPARAYMERVLARLASGGLDVAALFSHRMALEDGPRGYALFDEKRENCTKVLLKP
ncbi:MAG: alcohol dehydrogenase [Planctomycetes bacterium]|nr:alcohol dehydrogenase [Planctomycetota bacterium]